MHGGPERSSGRGKFHHDAVIDQFAARQLHLQPQQHGGHAGGTQDLLAVQELPHLHVQGALHHPSGKNSNETANLTVI